MCFLGLSILVCYIFSETQIYKDDTITKILYKHRSKYYVRQKKILITVMHDLPYI